MEQRVELDLNGKKLSISTGKVAKQANGSVMVQYGDTVVFASAVMAKKEIAEDPGFFPLSVHYIEKFYAAGKIPGGFIKREGKPSDKEVLVSRIIDRSLRPLFPDGFRTEVQIMPITLAADKKNLPDILGVIASSAALVISDIPFYNPVGCVRVALKDGKYIVNPSIEEMGGSKLNIVVSGTKEGLTMIEGGADFASEEEMVQAMETGYAVILQLITLQEELQKLAGKKKVEVPLFKRPKEIDQDIRAFAEDKLKKALTMSNKHDRIEATEKLFKEIAEYCEQKYAEKPEWMKYVKEASEDLEYELVRERLFKDNLRVDGRKPNEVRLIDIEVNTLPMVHGSSLFTRGETQALAILTLGSASDEQIIDALEGESRKRYMLHYNFPSFSVGETGRVGAPGRREIGHGFLAERSISAVIPDSADFPYTMRLVAEIMESNGSSSMATVCSCCMALMDGGVPIKAPVAGISIGLMFNPEKTSYKLLTDIQGLEDHYGDMDFKVAGTRDGITGFQLDIKVDAIPLKILKEGMAENKIARNMILDKMQAVLSAPRPEISPNAPKLLIIEANPDNIRLLIGPGGKTIKKITEEFGVDIDISDNGEIKILTPDSECAEAVYKKVYNIVRDYKVGDEVEGPIRKITDFGAFIQFGEGREGMCHISNVAPQRIRKIQDVYTEGQVVKAKIIVIDEMGRINLSIKDVQQ